MKRIFSNSNTEWLGVADPRTVFKRDEWYQSLLESSPDIIVAIDPGFKIVAFNESFKRFMRKFYGKFPVIGDDVMEYDPTFSGKKADWGEILMYLNEGKKWVGRDKRCYDGNEYFFNNSIDYVKNSSGEILGFNIFKREITHDVSSQKRMTAFNQQLELQLEKASQALENVELGHSEQKFMEIFGSSSVGIALVTLDGKVAFPNPSLCELLGYQEVELNKLTLADFTHPDDLENDRMLFEKLKKEEIKFFEIEKRYIRSDGRIIWGLLNASLLRDVNGKVTYAIGMVYDITKKKLLEQSVMEKNTELEKTNGYLDNFVHATAHDLRSPIANLRQIADLLIMLNKSEDEPLHEKLKESVSRLDMTVSGLIQIIDEQKLKENSVRKTYFAQKMADLQQDMAEKIQSLEAQIEVDFQAPCIVYPEPYLDSILRNLFQNSLKYNSSKRRPVIRISTWKSDGFVVLEVKDNGIGIDLKQAGERLFKPFKRFNNQTEGHGIGLHLVKSMVEKNDGFITVASEPGDGTCFTIHLKPYPKWREYQ